MSGIIRKNRSRSSGVVKSLSGAISIAGDKPGPSLGDMWYNSSTNLIRCAIPVAAWSAGGNLGAAKHDADGCGTQGAALSIAGNPVVVTCELYDGSSWGSAGNVNTGSRGHACSGTTTDAIKHGGYPSGALSAVETYNGTAWSANPTATPTGVYSAASIGHTSTSHTYCGGSIGGPTGVQDDCYLWNGSSWAAEGDMLGGRNTAHGCGTATAGLTTSALTTAISPYSPNNQTESYNGTAWSDTEDDFPVSDIYNVCGAGASTDCLYTTGHTTSGDNNTQHAYSYDGSSWTQETNFPIAVGNISSSATDTSADALLFMGGISSNGAGTKRNNTYEWDKGAGNATVSTE